MRQQELCDEEQLPDRLVNPCEYQQLSQIRCNDEDGSETENYLLLVHTQMTTALYIDSCNVKMPEVEEAEFKWSGHM